MQCTPVIVRATTQPMPAHILAVAAIIPAAAVDSPVVAAVVAAVPANHGADVAMV